MKLQIKKVGLMAFAMMLAMGSFGNVKAESTYTLGSLAEGTTPFLVNTAWATAVNKYVPEHRVKVSAAGGPKNTFLPLMSLNSLIPESS